MGINKEVISLVWEDSGGKEEKKSRTWPQYKQRGRKIEVNIHKHHQKRRHIHVHKERVEEGGQHASRMHVDLQPPQ